MGRGQVADIGDAGVAGGLQDRGRRRHPPPRHRHFERFAVMADDRGHLVAIDLARCEVAEPIRHAQALEELPHRFLRGGLAVPLRARAGARKGRATFPRNDRFLNASLTTSSSHRAR